MVFHRMVQLTITDPLATIFVSTPCESGLTTADVKAEVLTPAQPFCEQSGCSST